LAEGKIVRLEKDVLDRDGLGRLLRYVYVDELFVNAELMRLGYAKASPQSPNLKYSDLFSQLEAEAKEAGRGLWGECFPPIVVNRACSQFDAPGNDNQNRNEEYVCFTNQSAEAVNMTDWQVRDEAEHEYIFPAFTLNPGASVRLRTGCGEASATDLYWCSPRAVWNNDGDTVYLFDSQGQEVTRYRY